MLLRIVLLSLLLFPFSVRAAELPLIDAHIHYSEDAWALLSAPEAIAILRRAGLRKAFVSSSSDDGTQRLFAAAPELIVPVLRPYRRRGELGSWKHDDSVIGHVEARLAQHRYAGLGEFHLQGADAELPVVRRMVELARQHRLFLHVHSDAEAVQRILAQDSEARVLWAHAGFAPPEQIRTMLQRYDRLWCDLAFRSEHASGGTVTPAWRELFLAFPDRFVVGTDTYTPERWGEVIEHARSTRQWLQDLPPDVAERIAYRNAEALAGWSR